ncbi:MAG TPA: hypothetical protein VLF88_01105 [Candidatus Babeliales bacterium]|nr:hypothetical protein [Candidatus Babeliales bacterium]
MPDETRVFDVTRPSHVNPTATSRPVIPSIHPAASDPMVKDESGQFGSNAGMKIPISDETGHFAPELQPPPETPSTFGVPAPETSSAPEPSPDEPGVGNSPAIFSTADTGASSQMPAPANEPQTHPDDMFSPPADEASSPEPLPHTDVAQADEQVQPHIEQLHFNEPKHKRNWLMPTILVLLLLVVGAYLAMDSGLVKTSVNLPYHIFKQKVANTPAANPAPKQPVASSTAALPVGFKQYKIAGTYLTFAAPASWGDPTSATVGGFSKRGGTNQSDGTYAYVVDFATNKDVQIAVTSSKYLPPARTPLYYDYLQWCTGTNDNKVYQSVLKFNTTDKVDTPSTIVCDQGPLADAQKLNTTTIMQLKTKDPAGKVIGDVYTKNLKDPSLVVIRIKDAASTNGENIKQLLNSVKITTTAAASAPASQ